MRCGPGQAGATPLQWWCILNREFKPDATRRRGAGLCLRATNLNQSLNVGLTQPPARLPHGTKATRKISNTQDLTMSSIAATAKSAAAESKSETVSKDEEIAELKIQMATLMGMMKSLMASKAEETKVAAVEVKVEDNLEAYIVTSKEELRTDTGKIKRATRATRLSAATRTDFIKQMIVRLVRVTGNTTFMKKDLDTEAMQKFYVRISGEGVKDKKQHQRRTGDCLRLLLKNTTEFIRGWTKEKTKYDDGREFCVGEYEALPGLVTAPEEALVKKILALIKEKSPVDNEEVINDRIFADDEREDVDNALKALEARGHITYDGPKKQWVFVSDYIAPSATAPVAKMTIDEAVFKVIQEIDGIADEPLFVKNDVVQAFGIVQEYVGKTYKAKDKGRRLIGKALKSIKEENKIESTGKIGEYRLLEFKMDE